MLQTKIENTYSEFIAKRTYTRWLDGEKRRESWVEAVDRYGKHFGKYVPDSLRPMFASAIEFKKQKETMGSMRALWSAGPALEENSFAAFNCAYVSIDSIDKFGEILYVMMHGTGVGFSVERQFVQLLPEIPAVFDDEKQVSWVVQDSKLGWKEAFDHCIVSLFHGKVPTFDFSHVRPKGARLKTFGGRASGPEPLRQLFNFTIKIITGAKGRKLNSLECHDIATKTGECVVVGGVRRCLEENTLVLMSTGEYKKIKDVVAGEEIRLGEEILPVLDNHFNGEQELCKITLEDDTFLMATEEHRWYVFNHEKGEPEWIETKNLTKGNYSMIQPE